LIVFFFSASDWLDPVFAIDQPALSTLIYKRWTCLSLSLLVCTPVPNVDADYMERENQAFMAYLEENGFDTAVRPSLHLAPRPCFRSLSLSSSCSRVPILDRVLTRRILPCASYSFLSPPQLMGEAGLTSDPENVSAVKSNFNDSRTISPEGGRAVPAGGKY
jgi:hypothetical protein